MGTKRVEGKKKKKSIKAKAVSSMGSKRKLAKFGKQQQKGHKGIAANFLSRSQALKRLQLTLKDFRRLCILKGIYPRDPKKTPGGKDKVYYHLKDVTYLAHEPLLERFRVFKTFMRKLRRAAGRGQLSEARRLEAQAKPQYSLDHLVKERYPTFQQALADLDDALCLVHLFAAMPARGRVRAERVESCLRLCREWQGFVARARALSKVFVSVKGVYFQAEVLGEKISWLQPHPLSVSEAAAEAAAGQDGVDFRVMLTFLEFYEALLKFVLFKLYADLGVTYPPKIDLQLDAAGAHLAAIHEQRENNGAEERSSRTGERQGQEEDENKIEMLEGPAKSGQSLSKKKLKALKKTIKKIKEEEDQEQDEDSEDAGRGEEQQMGSTDDEGEEEAEEQGVLPPSALAAAFEQSAALARGEDEGAASSSTSPLGPLPRRSRLFEGLRFFLAREVPLGTLELVIRSLGGEVGWEEAPSPKNASRTGGGNSPFPVTDGGITHYVGDRPSLGHKFFGREYVQPQWVFDSANWGVRMPADKYAIGAALPPHLSPFVDDEQEGYTPSYKKEILQLQAEAGLARGQSVEESREAAAGAGGGVPGEDGEPEVDEKDLERAHQEDLEREERGSEGDDDDEDEEDDHDDQEDEEKEEGVNAVAKEEQAQRRTGPISAVDSGPATRASKRKLEKLEREQEEKEMAINMMGKKAKRLYSRMQHGIKAKEDKRNKLEEKRRRLEGR